MVDECLSSLGMARQDYPNDSTFSVSIHQLCPIPDVSKEDTRNPDGYT